jgi:hypothetical protein
MLMFKSSTAPVLLGYVQLLKPMRMGPEIKAGNQLLLARASFASQ